MKNEFFLQKSQVSTFAGVYFLIKLQAFALQLNWKETLAQVLSNKNSKIINIWRIRYDPMVSLNMKPIPDSLIVGGRKWLGRIHISEHIGLTTQNAKNYK